MTIWGTAVKIPVYCPGWCGSLDWVPACKPNQRVAHLIPSPGHMPVLQARSPVRGAWEVTTHWCFSASGKDCGDSIVLNISKFLQETERATKIELKFVGEVEIHWVNLEEEKVIWEGRLIYANALRQSRSWHIWEVKENQSVLCEPHPLSMGGNQPCTQPIEYCKGEKDIHDYMYVINRHTRLQLILLGDSFCLSGFEEASSHTGKVHMTRNKGGHQPIASKKLRSSVQQSVHENGLLTKGIWAWERILSQSSHLWYWNPGQFLNYIILRPWS